MSGDPLLVLNRDLVEVIARVASLEELVENALTQIDELKQDSHPTVPVVPPAEFEKFAQQIVNECAQLRKRIAVLELWAKGRDNAES